MCVGYIVHTVSECAIWLSGYLNIQDRDVSILFLIHGELNVAVQLIVPEMSLSWPCCQLTKVSKWWNPTVVGSYINHSGELEKDKFYTMHGTMYV